MATCLLLLQKKIGNRIPFIRQILISCILTKTTPTHRMCSGVVRANEADRNDSLEFELQMRAVHNYVLRV